MGADIIPLSDVDEDHQNYTLIQHTLPPPLCLGLTYKTKMHVSFLSH